MSLSKLGYRVKRVLRDLGWDLARADPDRSPYLYLLMLFEHFGINLVLDVGAHHGSFGGRLRREGYTGHIVSFEPVLTNFGVLQHRTAHDPKWTAVCMALGNNNGPSEIKVFRGNGLNSFLSPSQYGTQVLERLVVEGTQAVEVRRLDSILGDYLPVGLEPRVFLKLDTQGWDLRVLEGAAGCLDRIVGIQSEVSVQPIYEGMPTYVDSLTSLNQLGFELSAMFPVFRDRNMRLVEFDCMAVRSHDRAPAQGLSCELPAAETLGPP